MCFTVGANTGQGCRCVLIYCFILLLYRWHSCWKYFFQNRHHTIANTHITQIINGAIISCQRIWSLWRRRWCYSSHWRRLRRWWNSIRRKEQLATITIVTMSEHKSKQMLASILQNQGKVCLLLKLCAMNAMALQWGSHKSSDTDKVFSCNIDPQTLQFLIILLGQEVKAIAI